MITYTHKSPLEAAVLESGRFELATDTAGREVICVGPRRLPKVVLQQKAEALQGLVEAVGGAGGTAFEVAEGDPWQITEVDPDGFEAPIAAEEYLVMSLNPLRADGRPVRVAGPSGVVRLHLLPWSMPARTLQFGGEQLYVVTSTRSVVGEWAPALDGRSGVVVGVPELWIGIFERRQDDASLVLRCDVPVPWIGEAGMSNAIPTSVGLFEVRPDSGMQFTNGNGTTPPSGESWVAKLPIVLVEGSVVDPVQLPEDVFAEEIPDGPWELEWQGASDFSMDSLS